MINQLDDYLHSLDLEFEQIEDTVIRNGFTEYLKRRWNEILTLRGERLGINDYSEFNLDYRFISL